MSSTESGNIKITARDFISRYLRYLPVIIISVVIALAISYLYLRYTVPVYHTKATLLIKTNPQTGSNEDLENMFFNQGKSNVANEIQILRSLSLAKRVAVSLGLQQRYYTEGNIKTHLNYPGSPVELDIIKLKDSTNPFNFRVFVQDNNTYKLNSEESQTYSFGEPFENTIGTFRIVKVDSIFAAVQYKEHILTWEPLQNAAFFVLGGLGVSPTKEQTNILDLTYLTPQPLLGQAILNQLMIEYQKLNVEDRRQMTSQTIAFINERLDIITKELGDVEKDLQQYKQDKGIANLEAQSQIYIGNQSALETQIATQEVQKSVIKYLQEYIADSKNQYTVVPTTLGVSEPSLLVQVAQYNELQLERAAKLPTTTSENPAIKRLDIQIQKIRSDLLENLRNLISRADIELAKSREKASEYNANIAAVPIREKELLEISRQQKIKETLYLFLFQTREQTLISQAATISNSQIVDEALINWLPVTPKPLNTKIIAVFLGLVLPIGFIYIRELLNDKVNSKADISKATAAPIFGEIGHAESKTTLLVQKNRRDVVTEQFRMIRTNLKYLLNNVEKPSILITSTFSGEGKSFVSINTAAVMALGGKKTIVLEFDIRKPKIMTGLGLPKSQGITNYLVSNIPIESIIVSVPGVENLFVLPCGPIPPNPGETLLNPKMTELFRYVKANYDIVIVDTPPVGLVSDAITLSQYVDASFYIVRVGYTLKKQVHFIDELYQNKKLPNIGLLVNDIKASSHYYSYGNYGYGYGYGYGHSSGYFETETKQPAIKRFFNRLFRRK